MSAELAQERQKLLAAAQQRATEAEGRDSGWTPEDHAAVNEAIARVHEIDERIASLGSLRELESDAAAEMWAEAALPSEGGPVAARAQDNPAGLRAIARAAMEGTGSTVLKVDIGAVEDERALVRAGVRGRDLAQAARHGEVLRADGRGGVIARTLVAGTDASGGYTVPDTVAAQIYDPIADIMGVRRAGATVLTTESGNSFDLPTTVYPDLPGTKETSEAADAQSAEPTLGVVTFSAYEYTGHAELSWVLIEDSGANIEAYAAGKIAREIARKFEYQCVNGSGSSQPKGIIHSPATAQTTTTAGSNAIAYGDVSPLVFNLDAGHLLDKSSAAWLMHPGVMSKIVGLLDSQNRPIFTQSPVAGEPDTILGRPAYYTNHMPGGIADNDIALVVGNFRAGYYLRQVRDVEIVASMHAQLKKRLITYVGCLRGDGRIVDAAAFEYLKIKA